MWLHEGQAKTGDNNENDIFFTIIWTFVISLKKVSFSRKNMLNDASGWN